ncbi:MAG: rhomboid family intramembrane serine protease [Akkermansiaceae bacterium]
MMLVEDDNTKTKTNGMELIASFDNLREAQEYVLVILAMNLDCLISAGGEGYQLHASSAFSVAIREEFKLYEAEQSELQPSVEIPIFSAGLELFLLWATVLFFCYTMQVETPAVTERFLNSASGVIDHGEIYRPLTALFLHGSIGHLLSNIALGGIFCILVAHSLGPLTGWALIFASGFLGNVVNAVAHYGTSFSSLGASTATFGALGLLVGVGLYQAWLVRTVRSGLRVGAPLATGLMLFSMWGIGDGTKNIDVSAHLFGFGAGVLLGAPAALLRNRA